MRQEYPFGMNENILTSNLKDIVRFNIRKRRKEFGMSQRALAKLINAHQPNIAQIETGTSTPTLENIAKIAAALEVSPDLLLRPGIFSEIHS